MAKEIQALAPAGSNVYAQIRRSSDAQIWNGTAFETYNAANIGTYALAMTADAVGCDFFTANFPAAIAAGTYDIIARIRAGGSPAQSDSVCGTETRRISPLPVKDMTEAIWRWFYKKNVYDSVLQTQKTYADDGTTVNSTAVATVAAGVEVKDAAA